MVKIMLTARTEDFRAADEAFDNAGEETWTATGTDGKVASAAVRYEDEKFWTLHSGTIRVEGMFGVIGAKYPYSTADNDVLDVGRLAEICISSGAGPTDVGEETELDSAWFAARIEEGYTF